MATRLSSAVVLYFFELTRASLRRCALSARRAAEPTISEERTVRPRVAWQYTSDVRLVNAARPWRRDIRFNKSGGLQYWSKIAENTVLIDADDQEYILSYDENGNEEKFYISWIQDSKWHWRPRYFDSSD